MQLVIGAIGLGIGSMFGVPGIGWTIGSMLGSMLFGGGEDIYVKNETFGPRMKDLKVQTSMFGVPIPIAYGTNRLGGILIDADELKEHEHVEEETQTSTGGKGGSPSYTQTSTYTWYSYSCSFAVGFCKGPAETITRIWAGGDLIYDVTGNSDIVQIDGLNMRIYLGDESQEPDPTLESFHGAGEVPGYRGLVYIVFTDLDLTENFGNTLPNITAEVVSTSWTNTYTAIDMDVSVNISSGSYLLVDKWRPYAYHFYDGWIYKIDLIAGAVIASADIDHYSLGACLPCLDAAGRIYYPCRPGGGSWYVRRCDPDTLVWDGWVTATGFAYGIQDTACWGNVLYVSSTVIGDVKAYNTSDENGALLWSISDSGNPKTQLVPISEVELWAISSSIVKKIMNGQLDTSYDVSSSIASADSMFYLQRENVMIIGSTRASKLAKFNIYNGSITDVMTGICGVGTYLHAAFKHASMNQATIVGDIPGDVDLSFFADRFPALLYLPDVSVCREVDLIAMEIRRSWDAELFGIDCWLGGVYDWRTHSVLTNDLSDIWQCYLDRGSGGGEELDDIVSDLITNHESWMTEEQLTTDDIDVTDLESDVVHGYAITSQMSRRQAIEPLMLAYQFDACLEDSKIKFVKRGAANVATITEDDLGAYEAGGDPSEPLQTQQDHELELPCQVSVTYSNPSRDYEQGTQYSRRLLTTSQKTLTINLNIALSNNEAYRIAEKILAIIWTERYRYTLTTSREYLHLSPTDVIYVERDGDYYRMRIEKTSYGAPGLIPMECVEDCALDVDSDQEGAADDPTTSSIIPYYGPTRLFLLDIPMLREIDDDPGHYYAGAGYQASWYGAICYRSLDNVEYISTQRLTRAVICGTAKTALADGPTTVWDDGNTVDISIFNDESLESDTEARVYRGYNAALLGEDGSWEIIQWMTATLIDAATNTYRLSNLIRGRKGTEWATSLHAIGDRFIALINNGSIKRSNPGLDLVGTEQYYRAVSFGATLGTAITTQWTNTAVALKPYAPCQISGYRDGSGDFIISWKRRSRYGGEWRDYVDVPLCEDSEEYEVDIMGTDSADDVVRTIDGLSSATCTYTLAQQTTDFGGQLNEVTVRIYQVSSKVGRGYPGEETISYATGPIELEPAQMSFSLVDTIDPFDVEPSSLNALTETFATDTQFTRYTENTQGSFSVASNQATVTHSSGDHNDIITETGTELTVPQCFISIQVDAGGSGAGAYDCAGVGLAYDEDNYIFAGIDRINNIARIHINVSGSANFLESVSESGWTAPYKIGFSLVGNSACFWKDSGSGWEYITGDADVSSYYNFKTDGNLTGWKYAFMVASPGSTEWKFSDFKVGGFGCVALRDICCVSDIYGNAHMVNESGADHLYFTATAPDALGSSYTGLFKINLSSYEITQLGVIFVSRDSAIQNDLSAHIIRYDNGDRRLSIGTWGNGFGAELKVLHKLITSGDILSDKITIVESMAELDLPGLLTEDYGAYEAHIVWDDDNSRWLAAYSVTEDTSFEDDPFYGALAYSTDLVTWNLIGADTENQGWEGVRLINANGSWWMLVGGPCRGPSDTARIYDSSFTYIDDLDVTFDGGTLTQPHPMIFPYGGYWMCITFNDDSHYEAWFTWGEVQIFRSDRYSS